MDILDDMGVSKLSAKVCFFFNVNYSFNKEVINCIFLLLNSLEYLQTSITVNTILSIYMNCENHYSSLILLV